MKNLKLKQITRKIAATMLATLIGVNITLTSSAAGNNSLAYQTKSTSISQSSGWLESANVQWNEVKGASWYNVYYKQSNEADSQYKKLDGELIRKYPGYYRADILGISQGNYMIKIVPIIDGKEVTEMQAITKNIEVQAHTREGFAFSEKSPMKTASGGYNDDGTIPENAQIVYITSETVNTVQTDIITNSKGGKTTCTGIIDILAKREKGYDKRPLIIRMIGRIDGEDIKGLNSNGYIQIKGAANVTFEGVGEDATVYGWGFLIRSSSNVEIRNLGIMMFPDDAISLDTNNVNIWVHNNDIFYGAAGSDADQVKGDGSADVKGKSTYITLSYNHFYDSGKVSLCGMSDSEEFFVTYHHNWFDHSDSRHPRIRVGTVHIYNNYFDGNSKYGVGITKGGSAFVEANDYRNCKYPMLISLQGSDIYGNSKGNFSGEAGGMIKSYNNKIAGAIRLVYANDNSTQFDAYLAKTRNEEVPNTYKTLSGSNTYNNFDTSSKMYEYTPDEPEDVRGNVTNYAGRVNGGDFKWEFSNSEDTNYSVNKELMNAIKNYENKLISVGDNNGSINPPVEPDVPSDPSPIPPTTEQGKVVKHDFTIDNKESEYFEIKGSLSNSKGLVTYGDLRLTQCLKVDSQASIKFTTKADSTITLVFNSDFNKSILIDGVKYRAESGIVKVDLSADEHIITKGDTSNLFYIELVSNK